jgi:hypothetical protein
MKINLSQLQDLEQQLAASKALIQNSLEVTVVVASKGSFVGSHRELQSGTLAATMRTGKGTLEVPVSDGEPEVLPLEDLRGGTVYLDFPGGAEEALDLAERLDEMAPGLNGGRAAALTLRVAPEATRAVETLTGGIAIGLRVLQLDGISPAGAEPVSRSALLQGLKAQREANAARRQEALTSRREAAAKAMAEAAAEAAAKATPPAPAPKGRKRGGGSAAAAKALQKGMSASDSM